MPTYVYKFIKTGETIEVQQSFEDDALTEAVHPTSGTTMAVKKVFLPVGVTFKGDGFYKTDNRASQKKASAGSKESKDGASSGSSTSESSKESSKESSSRESSSRESSSKDTSKSSDGASGSGPGSKESSTSSSSGSSSGSSKRD